MMTQDIDKKKRTNSNVLHGIGRNKINRYEVEELILSMADIVVENIQLRQELKRLREVEKEYHDYIVKEYRAGEQEFRNIIHMQLENICVMMEN